MRPGSHADSLWGPLWNSYWSHIKLTYFSSPWKGKKTHWISSQQCLQSSTRTNIFIRLRGKFEVLCILSLDVRTPESVLDSNVHLLSLRQRPDTGNGWSFKRIMLKSIGVIRDTKSELVLYCFQSVSLVANNHMINTEKSTITPHLLIS